MKITRMFGHKASKLENLSLTILDELTFPSYPKEWLERVLSGEHVPTLIEVRQMRIISDKPVIEQPNTKPHAILREIKTPTIPPETEQQIAELQEQVHYLAEQVQSLTKELDIANEALLGKDDEIEKLQQTIESLQKDKNQLLDRLRVDSGKLSRLIMTMNQICGKDENV